MKLKPWLFKVARNKAMDLLRRNQKQLSLDDADLKNTGESINPADLMIKKDEFDNVKSQLEGISAIYREVVSLHIYGELTFKEISKVLRIPLGTALWRMQKALDLLREAYEKERNNNEK